MNKRTGKLIALLAVLAVAVAAYFVASAIAKREQNRNDTPDETKISIIDKETTDLVSVTVKAAGSDYTVAQSGGKYTLRDDADFPLDQDRAKDIAAAVTSVSADRRVAEAGADSSEYGLDSPLYTVTAKYSGGAEMTFRIGSYNRHTDSYYMSIAGEDREIHGSDGGQGRLLRRNGLQILPCPRQDGGIRRRLGGHRGHVGSFAPRRNRDKRRFFKGSRGAL